MGIQINFNTDDLSDVDVLVLGALARSLGDPEWAKTAETEEKPPAKRPVGRPRKTDEQRAAEAAEKAAADKAEKDRVEKLAAEKVSAVAEEPEETPAEPEKPAPAPRKAPATPAPSKPAPEPESTTEAPAEDVSEAEESDEDGKSEAIRLATSLVHDGRGVEVRDALKEVGAKKVSDLNGKTTGAFLAIVRSL